MSFKHSQKKNSPFLVGLQVPFLIFVVLASLALSGCSRRYSDMPAYLPFSMGEYENGSVGRFKTTYLAEQIDEFYRGTNPGPIGVTTFVNVNDLYQSSPFGRLCGEQLMSELAMRGYDVVELRQSDALQFVTYGGEFSLSRESQRVRPVRDLGGVIVGTYVVSPVRVYVNARLIDPSSSVLLSAASVEMGKTKEISRLLRGGSLPPTLERIPVRHLTLADYPYSNRRDDLFAWEERDTDSSETKPALPQVKAKGGTQHH